MKQNEFPPLPDQRQEIHDLTLLKRSSGLSPPEDETLLKMEAQETILPEPSDE